MGKPNFYYVFLLFGLAAIVFAPREYFISRKLIKTGIRTEAVVVEMVRSRSGKNNRRRKPVFEYTDKSGRVRTFKNNSSSIFDSYKIGDVVNIVYDPYTKVARVASFYGLYFGPLMILFVGGLFILVGRAGVLGRLEQ